MPLRAVIALAVAAFVATPALADEAAGCGTGTPDNPIVACVGSSPIHRLDLAEVMRSLPPEMRRTPPDKLFPLLVNQAVAQLLLEQDARAVKVQDDPAVKHQIELAERAVIVRAYEQKLEKDAVADPALMKTMAAEMGDEVCARHILVATEDEAKAIIAELDKGGDFAAIAKEKTKDPSGKTSGGDLGCFDKQQMVPEFADAAFAMQKGEFSKTPVKTKFGWHVIKLEDRKPADPAEVGKKPGFGRRVLTVRLKELMKQEKVELFNPDGSKIEVKEAEPADKAAKPDAAKPEADKK